MNRKRDVLIEYSIEALLRLSRRATVGAYGPNMKAFEKEYAKVRENWVMLGMVDHDGDSGEWL